MKKKKIKKEFLPIVLIIIFIPIFIILSNIGHIAFNENFYYKEFQKISSEIENRQEITSDLIRYFETENKTLILEFTESEQSHLEDVKSLLKTNKIILDIVLIILLSAFLALIFYFKKNIIKNISKSLIYSGVITDSLLVILLIISINFDFAFTLFHKILFPQGNWTFPLDSLLITLYPIQFFVDAAIKIFLNSFIIANILILIGFLLSKIKKRDRT